jgi:peptide/nickel transport system permease protein
MTFARQRYFQRVNASIDDLLSTEGAIIAARNAETGDLEEKRRCQADRFANINEVANVRLLLLGTDNFGRDITTQLIAAAGISLLIGLVAGLIATTIGLILGLMAGYIGGVVDDIIMFVTNLFTVIPIVCAVDPDLLQHQPGSTRRHHHRHRDRFYLLGVDCQSSAVAGLLPAQPRSRQPVEALRPSHRPHHLRRYFALHCLLCGDGVHSAGLLRDSGRSRAVHPGVGAKNNGNPDPGADDELGDDLPGTHQLGKWWAYMPVLLTIALITFSMNLMNTGLDQVFNPALRE